jgi:hypothetical protein
MAGEIWTTYLEGENLYAMVRRQTDGFVWETVGAAFEAWADANFYNPPTAQYTIDLTDGDGSYYFANFPSAIPAGYYIVYIFIRAGATPAAGDFIQAQGWIDWDGTEEVTNAEIVEDLAAIDGKIDVIDGKIDIIDENVDKIYTNVRAVQTIEIDLDAPAEKPRIIGL